MLQKAKLLLIIVGMLTLFAGAALSDDPSPCLDCCPPQPEGGSYSAYAPVSARAVWKDTNWVGHEVEWYPIINSCQGNEDIFRCPEIRQAPSWYWYFVIHNYHLYTVDGSSCYTDYGTDTSVLSPSGWHTTWSCQGQGMKTRIGLSSAECVLTCSKPGTFTLTATVYDDTGYGPNDPRVATWTIKVKPSPPKCFASDQGSRLGCGADGGGGSCSGSCGVDNDFPWSGIVNPVVYTPLPGLGGPGGGSSGGGGGAGGGSGDCQVNTVEVFETCNGYYLRVKDKCGKCYVFAIGDKPTPENSPVTFGRNLDDGSTLSGTLSSDGNVTCQIDYNDGTNVDFSLDAPSESNCWTVSRGPDSIVGADGSETTFTYGDTYDQVVTANGEVWKYYHASGDNKITKIEQVAAGASYMEIAYETTGEAVGKYQSIVVKDSTGAAQSQIDYTYYSNGKLETVTKGNRTRKFEYSEDDQVITVKDLDQSSATMTETVYDYREPTTDPDNDSGTLTTTVTRKHPTDPNKDQVTYYCFYTEGNNNKTYVHRIIDPYGKMTTYNLDYSTGQVYSTIDPSGTTTSYSYNSKGAVTQITRTTPDYQTFTETNSYYLDGTEETLWPKTHKDIHGNYTRYVRNSSTLWQVDAVKISPPIDGIEPTEQQWAAIDPIKQYDYYAADCTDGMAGQLWKETVPDIDGTTDQVIEYKYGYGVSGKWRTSPTQTIYSDASGTPRTGTSVYDDMGRVLSTTDADGRTIWYRYDALGRQTMTVYKWVNDVVDGTPEVYTQNSYTCCNLEWTRDENGNKTYYDYDDSNRVIKTWTDITGQSENAPLVSYTYDAFGNQSSVTTYSDANTSRLTTYTYDKNNRVTKIVYPYNTTEGDLIGSEEFGYDDLGNLLWKKDGNGDYTYYKYDALQRLTDVYYDAGAPSDPFEYPTGDGDVHYGYLEVGYEDFWYAMLDFGSSLKTSMTDSTGTSYYYYDNQGRLIRYVPSIKDKSQYIVEYTYNNLGQKTSVKIGAPSEPDENDPLYWWFESDPNDYWLYNWPTRPITNVVYDVTYDYFSNGWLKDVKSGVNTIASYSYDYVGNRTVTTLGNGTYTSYDYDTDPRYRLDSISHYKTGTPDVLLAEIEYASRDDAGNPESMTDWTGTWSYGYDDNNRLASAAAPNPVPSQPAGGSYGYDWVGDRIHPPADPNPMVYNKADQLTSWPGMHTYTYYGDGGLHEVKTGQTTVASYTYTSDGLLDTASYNSRTLSNTWDASKNRVSFTADSVTHTFVYDTTAGIPAVIQEDGIFYVREPNGALICRVDGEDIHYYHFDALGSTRLLTDGDGDITDKYSYDAYGSLISHDEFTGSIDQPYQYVGQLGYYTHWQEPEFGLLQLGVRFYDAEVGRFASRDPWTWLVNDERVLENPDREEGIVAMGVRHPLLYNLSIYCSDNPLTATDETGKGKWKCKNKKPSCWVPYGKQHWCRGCAVSCQEYCNDKFNDKPGNEWEKCSAACTLAQTQCMALNGYNFIAIW